MARTDIPLPDGYRLARYEELDSTNSEALRRAGEGEPHGLWVWARRQNSGRGRLGRRWDSLPGNLFASLLLRPRCKPQTATQLGFVGGLALYDAVKRLRVANTGPDLALKWPNDLLCAEMKAGGILLESSNDKGGDLTVIMGIGLNLSTHPHDTDYPATDLARHGIESNPRRALEQLARTCDTWLDVWNGGEGFQDVRHAWMKCSLAEMTPLEVKLAGERLRGSYGGIDKDGALLLICGDGTKRRITTGDVFPL